MRGVWVVIGLIRSGGSWVCSPAYPSLLFLFATPFPLPNPLYLFSIIPPGGPSIHGLWWLRMVVDVEERWKQCHDASACRVWWSFKFQSFPIVISISIVALSTGLLKSCKIVYIFCTYIIM